MPHRLHRIIISFVTLFAAGLIYLWVDRLFGLLALLIAAVLVIWQNVRRFRAKPTFDLKIEQEGKVLVCITLGLGFAALNTGSNLLYLILGMLLSLIVVSGVLSQLVLSKLQIHAELPESVRAQTPTLCAAVVHNGKSWWPSFNLVIKMASEAECSAEPIFIPTIESKQSVDVYSRFTFTRRGEHVFSGRNILVSTRFPFGMFTKTRRMHMRGEVLVLPKAIDTELVTESVESQRRKDPRKHTEEQEFEGLRLFIDGDDFRRVEWKRSTVGEQLIVREQTEQSRGQIHLCLIRSGAASPFDTTEEYWISGVAGLLEDLQTSGDLVSLHLSKTVIDVTPNRTGTKPALRALAQLQTSALPKIPPSAPSNLCIIDISRPLPWHMKPGVIS